MSGGHARLGPSASERWLHCHASVRLIEKLAAEGKVDLSRSSGAADEGTAAHQVCGDALELGLDAWDFLGSHITLNGVDYPCDEEVAAYLQPGIDWLRQQPGEMIVEHRVTLDRWMPGQFGTLDTAIIQRDRRRIITRDLKYGAGVDVSPVRNTQLLIYALGVVDNFDLYDAIDEVEIVIDQPRLGGMKHWTVSLDNLLAFGEEVRAAVEAIDAPDPQFHASEHSCGWCPVKDIEEGCPAYTRFLIDMLDDDDLTDLDSEPALVDPDVITPERRWHIVKHAHLITRWLGKLHEDCLVAAKEGRPDPGSKAVMGQRGNRKFVDPVAAEAILSEVLGADAYLPAKLIGIPAAEKALKPGKRKPGNPVAWADLEALITQDEGRPILVPVDDERPAIRSLADEIEDLDDLP